jgi:hypothetical protein
MDIKRIHYKDIENKLKECKLIRVDADLGWIGEGNGGLLYTDSEYYYKIWNSSWEDSDIVERAFNDGFYDYSIVSVFVSHIYDDDGNRGYITRSGKRMFPLKDGKSYLFMKSDNNNKFDTFTIYNSNTTREQRKQFMLSILNNAIESEHIHFDLTPRNIVLDDNKISLIDLNSYLSLNYIFTEQLPNSKTLQSVEEELQVKYWQLRYKHFNTIYKQYLVQCLNVNYNEEINSKQSLIEIRKLIA